MRAVFLDREHKFKRRKARIIMFKSFIFLVLFLQAPFPAVGVFETKAGSLKISLTRDRSTITRGIGGGLAVRVVKDPSFSNRDFGWIVEVVELPNRLESKNLLFQNPTGSTADLSQVYAWHIGDPAFPNTRRLNVKGYPLVVTINLKNAVAVGTGANSKFVAGKLKITWEWQLSKNAGVSPANKAFS